MKLFIWEGNGISGAYHDDGTLVVLAETPEQARAVVIADKRARAERATAREKFKEAGLTAFRAANPAMTRNEVWWAWRSTPDGEEWMNQEEYGGWDGTDVALARDPDQIIELDTPTIVAFNGGGYD